MERKRSFLFILRPLPGMCAYDTQECIVCLPLTSKWTQNVDVLVMLWKCVIVNTCLYLFPTNTLTYWEEVPRDRWCGEAGKHIVRAAEMGEVGAGYSLTPTLTPHQNLPALGLGSWRVAGVTCSHLHHPSDRMQHFESSLSRLYAEICLIQILIGHSAITIKQRITSVITPQLSVSYYSMISRNLSKLCHQWPVVMAEVSWLV